MSTAAEVHAKLDKDGGCAYPCERRDDYGRPTGFDYGLTMRDWFAGRALSGMIGSGNFVDLEGLLVEGDADVMARAAYLLADAMLAERNK